MHGPLNRLSDKRFVNRSRLTAQRLPAPSGLIVGTPDKGPGTTASSGFLRIARHPLTIQATLVARVEPRPSPVPRDETV
jgi:hypothetical protein